MQISSRKMGHFIYDPECILAEMEISPHEYKDTHIFHFEESIANKPWEKVVRRNLKISDMGRYLAWANLKLPFGKLHRKKSIAERYSTADPNFYLKKTKPHLVFNEKENAIGFQFLESLGIPKSAKIIGFNIRDNAYQTSEFGLNSSFNEFDPIYHDMRNSNIEFYYKSMTELVEKGYWVVRLGSIAEKKIDLNHKMIIDLPYVEARNPFIDIWMAANCYMIVSTGSGLDAFCQVQRIPTVITSLIPISFITYIYYDCIAIYKHITDEDNKKLSIRDLKERGAWNFGESRKFLAAGLKWEDNNSDEISEAIFEKLDKMEKRWIPTEVDELNQQRFSDLLIQNGEYSRYYPEVIHKVGSKFLKRNKYLLD